jgi:copper(I)-binding protein
MSAVVRRRGLLKAGVAFGAGVLLNPVRAHQFYTVGFTVVHPWTRATAEGTSSARICMIFEDVAEDDRLIGARSPLAEDATLIGTDVLSQPGLAIPAGRTTTLSETGMHLLLHGLNQPLYIAREYPITLLFEKVGALKATFTVDYLPLD